MAREINLRVTRRQTLSHLQEHVLKDLCTRTKGREMLEDELKVLQRQDCHQRCERRKQKANRDWEADFVFQIKTRATTSNKDISDRRRKWNVYSRGGLISEAAQDIGGGLVWIVYFASDWEWSFLKQVSLRGHWEMASGALPHFI